MANPNEKMIVAAVAAHMVRHDLPLLHMGHLFTFAQDLLERAGLLVDDQEQVDDAVAAAEADAIVRHPAHAA